MRPHHRRGRHPHEQRDRERLVTRQQQRAAIGDQADAEGDERLLAEPGRPEQQRGQEQEQDRVAPGVAVGDGDPEGSVDEVGAPEAEEREDQPRHVEARSGHDVDRGRGDAHEAGPDEVAADLGPELEVPVGLGEACTLLRVHARVGAVVEDEGHDPPGRGGGQLGHERQHQQLQEARVGVTPAGTEQERDVEHQHHRDQQHPAPRLVAPVRRDLHQLPQVADDQDCAHDGDSREGAGREGAVHQKTSSSPSESRHAAASRTSTGHGGRGLATSPMPRPGTVT